MSSLVKSFFNKFDGEDFISSTFNESELGDIIIHESGREARCYRKEFIDGDWVQFFEIGNLLGEFKKEIQK